MLLRNGELYIDLVGIFGIADLAGDGRGSAVDEVFLFGVNDIVVIMSVFFILPIAVEMGL